MKFKLFFRKYNIARYHMHDTNVFYTVHVAKHFVCNFEFFDTNFFPECSMGGFDLS